MPWTKVTKDSGEIAAEGWGDQAWGSSPWGGTESTTWVKVTKSTEE